MNLLRFHNRHGKLRAARTPAEIPMRREQNAIRKKSAGLLPIYPASMP
jgi:hypothetical protein